MSHRWLISMLAGRRSGAPGSLHCACAGKCARRRARPGCTLLLGIVILCRKESDVMEDESGNKISPFCIKMLIIYFIFCRHCYARGGERVPGAVRRYVRIRHWTTQLLLYYSYCNYNAALMMILCFSGDIIHLFPYRKSGITFRGICECNIITI